MASTSRGRIAAPQDMPEPIEPQLDELRRRARRRLVGAIVLALAAAVIVPMLLESEPKPLGEDVSVKIPPVDDGKFVSKLPEKAKPPAATAPAAPKPETAPAPAATPSRDTAKEPAAGASATSLADSERRVLEPTARPPTKDAATPAIPREASASDTRAAAPAAPKSDPPKPAVAEAPKPAPAAPSQSAASSGTFSVQLAAFADDKGANALAGRLKKAGHPAYTEPYETSRGTLWRVRVGPYPTREAAEVARGKLKAEGQSGIIAAAK